MIPLVNDTDYLATHRTRAEVEEEGHQDAGRKREARRRKRGSATPMTPCMVDPMAGGMADPMGESEAENQHSKGASFRSRSFRFQ